MNKTTILAISIVFVASILAITAFEAEADKPENIVFLKVFSQNNGELICPNGVDKLTSSDISMNLDFSEEILRSKGTFNAGTFLGPFPQKAYVGDLINGQITSDGFLVTGIGLPDGELVNFCGEPAIPLDVIRIWGECGNNATINFESDSGYSGTFTDKVVCL